MIGKLLYSKKRRDRWWRFTVLKDTFIEAQQVPVGNTKELVLLDRALRRIGYGAAPERLAFFWRELLSHGATRKEQLQPDDLQRIEHQVGQMDPAMLPALCWLDLYRLCLGIGFFQLARALREHGLTRMVADAHKRDSARADTLALGLYAQLEREDFADAAILLKQMGRELADPMKIAQARWFLQLLAGTWDGSDDGMTSLAALEDLAFGRFIRGQRIALVGPVPIEKAQGAEIDDHDVVVKFGYRGGDKGRDPDTQGARIDVSYYNNTQSQQLARANYGAVLSSLRWAVFHNRKGHAQLPKECSGTRQLVSFMWLLADTHFNAGPNAMVDMLRFRPAGVRVFNTDLMLSSGRFAGYNPAGAPPVDYIRSFIKTHDPILQYAVTRRLWTLGYLSGDERFSDVMEMGLRRYLDELQNAHGAGDRALI
ncbi:hypothetical protein [Marinobacter sp. M-5]|uniref:hypothetical protein n=1 Tax=Marinobacter sp. M-5 TaxID=3081089 RepID=UPI00293CCF64|nr:hypothetical protein [Marinobacter sp. M-5]MDV3505274.1 hypothetical protein [Marinobacter sp. M-5]